MDSNPIPEYLIKYQEQLISLQHKSQEAFERQLSYISAGSLALSVGFIKDVIKNIELADSKWLLSLGWVLLIATLLMNCISHIASANLHNKTIKDITNSTYKQTIVSQRYKKINLLNWSAVFTMVIGITAIVFFVIKNIYRE